MINVLILIELLAGTPQHQIPFSDFAGAFPAEFAISGSIDFHNELVEVERMIITSHGVRIECKEGKFVDLLDATFVAHEVVDGLTEMGAEVTEKTEQFVLFGTGFIFGDSTECNVLLKLTFCGSTSKPIACCGWWVSVRDSQDKSLAYGSTRHSSNPKKSSAYSGLHLKWPQLQGLTGNPFVGKVKARD